MRWYVPTGALGRAARLSLAKCYIQTARRGCPALALVIVQAAAVVLVVLTVVFLRGHPTGLCRLSIIILLAQPLSQ